MNKNTGFRKIFIILSLTASLSACESAGVKNNQEPQPGSSKINESFPLGWEGRYAGILPAADCPGINVQITLHSDQTFSLVYDYIDREVFFTETGAFELDEDGNVIILKASKYPSYYRLEKDRLRQLDILGNEITGNLAEMFVLKKAE